MLIKKLSVLTIYVMFILLHVRHKMVNMFVSSSSAVHLGFEPRSCQTKNYKIPICCYSAKHAALMSKSKN